jgi:hypothetical protein
LTGLPNLPGSNLHAAFPLRIERPLLKKAPVKVGEKQTPFRALVSHASIVIIDALWDKIQAI